MQRENGDRRHLWLGLTALVAVLAGTVWALFVAPPDAAQGEVVLVTPERHRVNRIDQGAVSRHITNAVGVTGCAAPRHDVGEGAER